MDKSAVVDSPPEVTCVSEGGGIDETVCLRVVEDGSKRGVGVPDPSLYLQKGVSMSIVAIKKKTCGLPQRFEP